MFKTSFILTNSRNVRESDFGVYECGTNITGGKQIRQKIHLSGE